MADHRPHLSFSNKIWNFLECDQEKFAQNKNKTNLSDLNIKILMNRGFSTPSQIETLLNSKLNNRIPDPSLLLDMDKAVSRIIKAIKSNEKILVFGDYDVDGISATFLIVKYLQKLEIFAKYCLPSRFVNGYGLSENVVNDAINEGIELIVVVDSGVNEVAAVQKANEFGMDVIIFDHHIQHVEELPRAVAVVNPNRKDQEEIANSNTKCLCAAGVVFLFMIAIQRELKNIGFWEQKDHLAVPDLYEFISIVALATLCDVMEIKGVNRAFVQFSLKHNKFPTGLGAILSALKIEKISSADDFSYLIGPLINSAGRVGNPMLALEILLDDVQETALANAMKLLKVNTQRKNMEKVMLSEALLMIDNLNLHKNNVICVSGDNWNEGVIGILAGKIKDMFQKPTFVISFGGHDVGKGSARSVLGAHLGDVFSKALEQGLITSGGGHALAGGFSIKKNQVDNFYQFLNQSFDIDFVNFLNIDSQFSINSNLQDLTKEISILAPFGNGLPKPIFCAKRLRIKSVKKTQNNAHLMIFFSGEFSGNMRGIVFNISSKNNLMLAIEKNKDQLIDIAAFVTYDKQYGGSLILADLRLHE